MIFVHYSKSAHAIGQNRSRVFWLPGNKSFECVITITHEKCAGLKMARSKRSRKLYLQVDRANKLMKMSMNSTIKTKKENNLENFYRQRYLVNTDYSHFFVCELSHESSFNRLFFDLSLCLFACSELRSYIKCVRDCQVRVLFTNIRTC